MPDADSTAQKLPERQTLLNVPEGWISTKRAATILRCSDQTIRNRIACGKLAGAMCETPSGNRFWVDPQSDEQLSILYAPEEQTLCQGKRLAGLSASQRKTAAGRLEAVLSWKEFRLSLPTAADVMAAYDTWVVNNYARLGLKKPPSWATMWRWVKAFDSDGLAQLAPRCGGPSPAEPCSQSWAFFQTLYLQQQKRSIQDCWNQTKAASHKAKWTWVSYAVCRNKVLRDIPLATRILYREGKKAHDDKCVPYIERDYESLASNDWWITDHHQLDIAAIGPNGRPEFPWITTWQDARSRKIVGLLLHFCPNLDVVLASLRRALLTYGVPANFLFDNGKEFRANAFTGGRKRFKYEMDEARVRSSLHHLPCEVHFAQPYNAKAKPNERMYRTLRMQFSQQWATYRGNCTDNRPEQLAKILKDYQTNGLVPKAADLEKALIEWVDNVYHKNAHRGRSMDGQTPDQIYRRELQKVTRVSENELILLMMRTSTPRVVGRNGIKMFGYSFNAPELFGFQGKKVYARYDIQQIGKLYIHDLKDRLICVALRQDLMGWNASHEDVRTRMKLKAQHRKAAASFRDTSDILTGDAIQNIALQRQQAQAVAQHDGDDGGDGERMPRIQMFRSALADSAEAVQDLRRVVGIGGDNFPVPVQPAARSPKEKMDDFFTTPQPQAANSGDDVFDTLDI